MKAYEIAKELNVDHSTISRDIKYLTSQSQSYLNSLAKETLPFIYQTSIEGIHDVIKQCWSIYQLVDSGPSVMYLEQLQERLVLMENRQAR
jgi:IS30 family transposase